MNIFINNSFIRKYFWNDFTIFQTKTEGEVLASDWKIDSDELASKFTSKTKAILVNTPHNPVGKVFTLEELTVFADLCKKHDVLYISDEVYEHLVYKPHKHIRVGKSFIS